MLKTENCPKAAPTYSAERMVLNQNRGIAIALEAPVENIEAHYYDNIRIAEGRKTHFFLFASYIPILLATSASEEDNSGLFVLIACCVLAFFLFGGRRSKQIKD